MARTQLAETISSSSDWSTTSVSPPPPAEADAGTVEDPQQQAPPPPKKHCWECLRRRLVCDSAKPACNRCRDNAIVCPGYDDKQPLRWVKTGQVTVRAKRRAPPATAQKKQKGPAATSAGIAAAVTAATRVNIADNKRKQQQQEKWITAPPGEKDRFTTKEDAMEMQMVELMKSKFGSLAIFGAMQARALEQILRFDITHENFAAMQAAYHYNVQQYHHSSPVKLLYDGPQAELPPPAPYAMLPAPLKCLMILIAMSYQANRLPPDTDREVIARSRFALANWKYQVVQTLNADIADEKTRLTDGTLTSVYILLIADQAMETPGRWRVHYNALMTIIRQRGGVRELYAARPNLRDAIHALIVMEAFANSTSPSHDQTSELTSPDNMELFRSVIGDGTTPTGTVCPLPVFFDVVRTNHLRAESTAPTDISSSAEIPFEIEVGKRLTEAEEVLQRLRSFSPVAHAQKVSNSRTYDNWVVVGKIYQSAALIYCILSLQCVFLLPQTRELEGVLKTHYDRLLIDLQQPLRNPNLQCSLTWPVMVAGVHAARGTAFERAFVADQLRKLGRDLACASANVAASLLAAFWNSGRKAWDECWLEPHWFSMV